LSAKRQTDGKTVLVTGGTDGLGRAAALLLAARGYRVFAAGRNAEKLAELEKLAGTRKLTLEPVELDVCDEGSVDECVSTVERRAGPPDVVINSAGIAIFAAMEDISLEDLQKQYETNVLGTMRVVRRVLPEMRRRRLGRIINMSSVSGKVAHPLFGPYSSSKHALEAISDAMRLELFPFDIQVVLIEPGYIPTNISHAAATLSAAYTSPAARGPYAPLYERHALGFGKSANHPHDTPEACARVVLRAVTAREPHARYRVTRAAKLEIFAKWLLPDRVWDRRCRKIFGLDSLRHVLDRDAKS
jgi:NAD(P)-dependent dehydrogenase (short-subunit alcohol dehydrogenase family)